MSVKSWLPAWFRPPVRVGLSTGHHLRPCRATDADCAPDAATVRYVLLDEEERSVLGWVDFRPGTGEHDALVSSWVVGDLAGGAVEAALADTVADWVRRDWPFERPRVSSDEAGRAPLPPPG